MPDSAPSINQQTALIPISSIRVDWTHRYRHGDWSEEKRDEILESLLDPVKGGLLYPIIIDEEHNLRAGGHRLSAFLKLFQEGPSCPFPAYDNWQLIPAFVGSGFSSRDWDAIEKAENFLRREISWFPRAKMIHEFHLARLEENYKWSPKQTAACLSISHETAAWSVSIMALYRSDDPADLQAAGAIQRAGTFRAAYEIAKRRNERVAEQEREAMREATRKPPSPAVSVTMPAPAQSPSTGANTSPNVSPTDAATAVDSSIPGEATCPIHHTTLSAFTAAYSGPRFNLIHCDPPYGINRHLTTGQGSRQDVNHYDDSEDTFWSYISDLSIFLSRHAADSAHLILWLPPDLFRVQALVSQLLDLLPFWKLDPTPFIWVRADSAGVAPAPAYSGRRTYEWALLFSQGSRKIVQVKDMAYTCPYGRDDRIHESEKPYNLIRYLCSMFVDSTTVAIDPTAGSGRPLQAIHSLGAGSVTGLEKEEAIHASATKDWLRYAEQSSPAALV
jgi:hypothetical protein